MPCEKELIDKPFCEEDSEQYGKKTWRAFIELSHKCLAAYVLKGLRILIVQYEGVLDVLVLIERGALTVFYAHLKTWGVRAP